MPAKEPSHGYELRARLKQALGPVGEDLNAGQVHVTLTRLEKAGLVVSAHVPGQPERPDRKVYELTAMGQHRVAEWLAEVSWPRPDMAEFHLKLIAAGAARLADPLAIVDAQRVSCCAGCGTRSARRWRCPARPPRTRRCSSRA